MGPLDVDGGALSGKLAVVIGVGQGIGQAVAIALANAGARVVLAGRSLDRLHETRNSLPAGGDNDAVEIDVASTQKHRGSVGRDREATRSAGDSVQQRGLLDHQAQQHRISCMSPDRFCAIFPCGGSAGERTDVIFVPPSIASQLASAGHDGVVFRQQRLTGGRHDRAEPLLFV